MRLALYFRDAVGWVLDRVLQALVSAAEWHGHTLILEVVVVHEDVAGSLLEEIHFRSAEIELVVVLWLLLDVLECFLLILLIRLQLMP